MNGKKFLIGSIAAFVIVWISLLIVISEDIYDRRPVISLFKMLQSDGSTEIVDFEVDNKKSNTNKPEPNIDKNPYYGDLHVHTKYSFDAYVFGVTASPDDAYNYAKGAAIKHPLGYDMQLREPLDFYAVTDHGFFMGMIQAYADTSTGISQKSFAEPFHNINRLDNLSV